jgi:RNA 2',3'-cyclic 3'-phosphodiesterase
MKNRRIFVSINLDEATKKYISKKIEPLKEKLDASWTKPEQFHVTLSFLGFVTDETVSQICQQLKKTLSKAHSFDLFFNSLETIPSPEKPKMLWLKGDASEELLEIKKLIDQAIENKISKRKEFEMKPHITLARLKKKQDLTVEQMHEVVQKITVKASVPATNVDVMESFNEKGIWRHCPLEQIEL